MSGGLEITCYTASMNHHNQIYFTNYTDPASPGLLFHPHLTSHRNQSVCGDGELMEKIDFISRISVGW